jgi:hypothetical protein
MKGLETMKTKTFTIMAKVTNRSYIRDPKAKLVGSEKNLVNNLFHALKEYELITSLTSVDDVNRICGAIVSDLECLALNNYEFPDKPQGTFNEFYTKLNSSVKKTVRIHHVPSRIASSK